MPPNTVYVGRPTCFGNPFQTAKEFEEWLNMPAYKMDTSIGYKRGIIKDRLSELRGKNLACWCSLDKPCHADVLLELANK